MSTSSCQPLCIVPARSILLPRSERSIPSVVLTRQIKQRGFVKLWRFLKQPFHPALSFMVFPADSPQTIEICRGWAPGGAGCCCRSLSAGCLPLMWCSLPVFILKAGISGFSWCLAHFLNQWHRLCHSTTDGYHCLKKLVCTGYQLYNYLLILQRGTDFCVVDILLRKLISYFCW